MSHIPQEHNGIEPGFAREYAQSTNLYESVHPGFLEEYQYTSVYNSVLVGLSPWFYCWIHWTKAFSHDSSAPEVVTLHSVFAL